MSIEIVNCIQGTDEWRQARAGIPTASRFKDVISNGRAIAASKGGGFLPSETRRTYLLECLGERLTGVAVEGYYYSAHTERGHVLEEDARDYYRLLFGVELIPSGFIKNGLKGCSADSLIGTNGMLEIKSKLPKLQLELLLAEAPLLLPTEHYIQAQGQLLVAEREWNDLMCYSPGLPPIVKRVYRDEVFLKALEQKLDQFTEELLALEASVRMIPSRIEVPIAA